MIIPWTSGSGDTRIKLFSRVFVNLLPVSMVESPINPTAFSCQKHRKTAPKSDRSASSRPHAHDLGQGLKTSFATLKRGQSELKLPPYPIIIRFIVREAFFFGCIFMFEESVRIMKSDFS